MMATAIAQPKIHLMDVCTVEYQGSYGIKSLKSCKLSAFLEENVVLKGERQYIKDIDERFQELGFFVPEAYKIPIGIRLTYREQKKYVSLIFEKGNINLELIRGWPGGFKHETVKRSLHSFKQYILELSIFLNKSW